jgi:drug/metabolite transporter (DMT)-like permease
MSPTQLLFIRSITSALIFMLLMNKKIAYYMYTSIDKKHYGNVAIRVAIGVMMLVCIYTSVKYLPLVYVALVSNLTPLVTALFSYMFLKKGLNRLDTLVLFVSFAGVVLLITCNQEAESVSKPMQNWSILIIPIITLLL